jgi:hypothetical protein
VQEKEISVRRPQDRTGIANVTVSIFAEGAIQNVHAVLSLSD